MYDTIRNTSTACFLLVLGIGLTSARVAAQQKSGSSALRTSVMRLASQGEFDAADRAMETSLGSTQPDYDVFWEYLDYLVNQAQPYQNVRAAQLGQKWQAVVRRAPPMARGRIMKQTGIAMMFGLYSQTRSAADRTAARRLLEDAVEANPRLCEAYLHLALIAALEGRLVAGLALLDRTIETADDDEQRAQFISIRDQCRKDSANLVTLARRVYRLG